MDKKFYKRALMVAVPIMVQNGITNFVSMLDNIMIGQVGTHPMSAVAIVNQLIFVFNLCIFGGLAGIAIFTAQFFGRKNEDGVRYTFRLMIITALILSAIGLFVFYCFPDRLISLYLHEGNSVSDITETMMYAKAYLKVMMLGMLPFALTQVYSTTLRSVNQTVVPMRASMLAVAINLVGNYILIYGKSGFPQLGVVGAAIATGLSRVVELIYIVTWTLRNKEKTPFLQNVFSNFYIPSSLTRNCLIKGMPLLCNEFLWSASQVALNSIYSYRGLSVVAAFNISQTVSNVFNIAFMAFGNATGIIIGQELGAGHFDTVKKDAKRITFFTLGICVFMGALLFVVSGFFPEIYNTSDEIKQLAGNLIKVASICMPMYAYANASYFILRSGGKTIITFLFDSCFCWSISIPIAFLLVHMTSLEMPILFLIVQLADLIKCTIGFILIEKGVWINDITSFAKEAA